MFTLAKQKQCLCGREKKRVEKNQHPTVGLLMCCYCAKEALRLTHVYRNGVEHVVQKHTQNTCESQLHRRLSNTACDTRCASMITDIPSWKGAESAIATERNESVSSDFSRLVVAQENYTIKFSNSDRKHSVFESSLCRAKRPILSLLWIPFRVSHWRRRLLFSNRKWKCFVEVEKEFLFVEKYLISALEIENFGEESFILLRVIQCLSYLGRDFFFWWK